MSNRPLHMLTRSPTGLMSNTAGTTYFYPPECCADQPYNTYAADVAESRACDVDLGAGRDAVRDGSGAIAAVQPRSHRLYGRSRGEGGGNPRGSVASVTISLVFLCFSGGLNVRDLLGRFLDKDPAKRISIDEILVAMEGRSDA